MPVWALHVQERATLNILKVGLIIYIYIHVDFAKAVNTANLKN